MSNNNESRGDSDSSSSVNDDLEPFPVVDNTIIRNITNGSGQELYNFIDHLPR
jgi:hypothetical protein